MPSNEQFVSYLLAALPEEYPIAGIPLSFKMEDAHRKEVVFQQGKLLEIAGQFLENAPWVSLLASMKHRCVLEAFEIHSASFHEIADKEYFANVELAADDLVASSASRCDSDTRQEIERLLNIQACFPEICLCLQTVNEALQHGIRSFEPPKELTESRLGPGGWSVVIVGSLLVGIVASLFAENWSPGGAITIVAITALLIHMALMYPLEERNKKVNKEITFFNELRDTFYASATKIKDRLQWHPLAAAENLVFAAEHLRQMISDREDHEQRLVKPFV